MNEHYKVPGGEEHHTRVRRLKLGWHAANITKYAERAERKGQLKKDVLKIIDYAQMWLSEIEKDEAGGPDNSYNRQAD